MDLPLFVRDLEGSVHPVAVSVSSSVEEIFEQLQGIVATDGCDLLLEGVPLTRTDEVAETGVAPDDVLQLTSKKLRLTWQVYDGDNSAAELLEDGTAVVNRFVRLSSQPSPPPPLQTKNDKKRIEQLQSQ